MDFTVSPARFLRRQVAHSLQGRILLVKDCLLNNHIDPEAGLKFGCYRVLAPVISFPPRLPWAEAAMGIGATHTPAGWPKRPNQVAPR